jgi:hypothetical protein
MENLERCPDCYKLPEVKIEDKGFDKENFIFSCPQHGHMAMGQTVEGAKANWNLYVMLMKVKVA